MDKNIYEEFPLTLDGAEFLYFIDGGFYRGFEYFSGAHAHSFCELLYVVEGCLTVLIGDTEYQLSQGELLALPRGSEHTVHAPAGTAFTFLSVWDKANLLSMHFRIPQFPAGNAFMRLLDYYYGTSSYRYELIQACLVEITVHLLDALKKGESSKVQHSQGKNTRLYAIEYYMHAKYNDEPSLTELARVLHLSVSQTDRTVRKLYGCSFSERIRFLRIGEAKKLLRETDMEIYRIATTVGYATANGFHIAFKQLTGRSPGEYREEKSTK